MGTTSDKLTYLNGTKTAIKNSIELMGATVSNQDTFRSYANKIKSQLEYYLANGLDVVWDNWNKVTGTGETITLNNTIEAKMNIVYKGNTSQKTTTGKNLFNASYYKNQEIYTETISIVSGDLYCTKLYLKPNTTYTISEALNNWTLTGAWIFVIADTNNQIIRYLQNRPQDYQTNPTTFTTNSDGYIYIGHRYGFSDGVTNRMHAFLDTVNIQIEEGNTATSFEEYTNGASPNPDYPQEVEVVTGNNSITITNSNNTQSTNYPINLGSIELCKIGDYQDRIFKAINGDSFYDTLDSTTKESLDTGSWYKYSAIGKVVLDGSENWSLDSTTTNYYEYKITNLNAGYGNSSTAISNYFNQTGYSRIVITGSGTLYLRYPTAIGIDVSTVSLFKTWLSNNNTTVYYVIATPTYTKITDELLTYQLEQIKYSYSNQTNISQTNNDMPFILDVTALKNM